MVSKKRRTLRCEDCQRLSSNLRLYSALFLSGLSACLVWLVGWCCTLPTMRITLLDRGAHNRKSERKRHDRPTWRRPCGRGAARRAKAAAGGGRGGSPRRALAAAGRTVIGNGLLGSLQQLIKRLTAHSVSALDCLWRPPRLRAALLLDGAAPRRRRGDAAAATDIH